MGQNEIIIRNGQHILELQGELAQVRNLANLSVTLNTPLEPQMDGHSGAKSQTSTPSHQMPSTQNIQNLPPPQNIQNLSPLQNNKNLPLPQNTHNTPNPIYPT